MKLARTTTGKYVVEAVIKALDVLEVFETSETLSLNEISKRVGLNKSRTFRLLQTLAERGYIERCADGTQYKLGLKLLERAAGIDRNLKQLARGPMLRLQERFNETVNLGVLDDYRDVLFLDIVETSRPFRMTATVGCRIPAHQTALGMAILAFLDMEDPASPAHAIREKLGERPARLLSRELQKIRERGYAIDNEQCEPGVGCIGAAIRSASGLPVASISVAGHVRRILVNEKKIALALLTACREISGYLGYEASPAVVGLSSAPRIQPRLAHTSGQSAKALAMR
jgi:DNA-binding IclR family transcriptional regulator